MHIPLQCTCNFVLSKFVGQSINRKTHWAGHETIDENGMFISVLVLDRSMITIVSVFLVTGKEAGVHQHSLSSLKSVLSSP